VSRPSSGRGAEALEAVQSFALGLPEAWEDHPWDDVVAKVGKKVFVFMGRPEEPSMSVKLPESADLALALDCCAPTGYGLGRWGWVSVTLSGADCPAVEVLLDWVEESYRTIAPKKLVARLDAESDEAETADGR
jgi:predicted DNA-binding protein (MmcQ/YjbR family)